MKVILLTLAILVFAPVAFSQDGLTVEVTAIRANIRRAPSAKARIVKSVPLHTPLEVYAFEPRKGWYLVRLGENFGGWIKATFVRVVSEKKPLERSEGL